MIQQSLTVGKISKMLHLFGLTALLYPIQHFTNLKQLQISYIDPKSATNIISRCYSLGVRGWYRGATAYGGRMLIIGTSITVADLFADKIKVKVKANSEQQNNTINIRDSFKVIAGVVAYMLVYPLEILQVRMATDIDRIRYYPNLRQTISKIRKNQGKVTLYRGFLFGLATFASQFYLTNALMTSHQYSLPFVISSYLCMQLLFYPLSTAKKLYQLNGALGHADIYTGVSQAFKKGWKSLMNGAPLRFMGIAAYGCAWVQLIQKNGTYDQ